MKGSGKSEREAFGKFLEGNGRFRKENSEFRKLAEYQNPEAVIITCSDSRVPPSIIMDAPLGSVFEIRVAGEVIDESTLASVEFAVQSLGTGNILVVGHTGCGAVTEAHKLFSSGDHAASYGEQTALERTVRKIFSIISLNPANRNDIRNSIVENTFAQARALLESRTIREKYEEGGIVISAAIYDLASGVLEILYDSHTD